MANANYRNMCVVGGVVYSTVSLGRTARAVAYGRTEPVQLDDPHTDPETGLLVPGGAEYPVLIQAAQDVYTQDDSGFAYTAGQWWIRMLDSAAIDTDRTAGHDSSLLWVGVPGTLPAGFTAVARRNTFPSSTMNPDAPIFAGIYGQSSPPNYGLVGGGGWSGGAAGDEVVRTADGAYKPMSTTVNAGSGLADMPYGPANVSTSCALFSWDSLINSAPYTNYCGYHPGYRNVRCVFRWRNVTYVAAGAGDFHSVTVGSASVTIHKADLAFDGTYWTVTKDLGATTPAAVGALTNETITVDASIPLFGPFVAFFVDVYLSPRLDVPCPFNATSGNTCVPGGIGSGTVPGF